MSYTSCAESTSSAIAPAGGIDQFSQSVLSPVAIEKPLFHFLTVTSTSSQRKGARLVCG